MTAALKCDPSRLPVPRLSATHSVRPDPIPEGLPVIELPRFVPVPKSEPKPKESRDQSSRKGRSSFFTSEMDEQLKEFYKSGMCDDDIADRMHLEKERVKRRIYALKRNGYLKGLPPRKYFSWTEKEQALLISLYKHGASFKYMAEELGKSIGACQTRCYELKKEGRLQARRPYVKRK